jgi:pre-mRNA-processing factor SLU7
MSQQHFSEPPSILARRKDGEGPKKQTREEYRKQKELEELRKAGNAPAEVDESGKDINPHIPKYMVDVPWYVTYDHSKPTLKHQRYHDEKKETFDGMDKWYHRGLAPTSKVSIKYREGACENCGAMGHSRKDCLEKPRKRLAKYGAQVIAPDDSAQPSLNLTFDGKRDRWNGVDMDSHQEKIRADFEKLEEARRLIKSKQLDDDLNAEQTNSAVKRERDSDDEEEDEDKYADEMELPGQKLHLESKQRISVRNLRMREDTAKYLLNLDPNSAYYDPKSRSMRDNPFSGKQDSSSVPYIGDNYVRYSGEANKFAKSQMFAWEAADKGVEVHQQADPTKLELLHKEFKQRYEECAKNIKASVLEKYGGAEHLEALPKELIFAQTENYSEYNRYGNVVKTQEKAVAKSKYVEDELANNHTSVWGSYFEDGKWGYKCCRSFEKNKYCTGLVDEESAKTS